MKIALVSPYDWSVPGGVNSHVGVLAGELERRGHAVRVIAPASEPVADPRVTVIGRPVGLAAAGSMVRIAIDPRLGRQVRAVLEREQFDVVHIHEPLMPALPLAVLKHSRQANPAVVNVGTFHAYQERGSLLYRLGRRWLNRYVRELDARIAVSPPAAAYVSRTFPGDYQVIPNGIDITHWANPALTPLPDLNGTFNILFVGRADRRKGLPVLLRAFERVRAAHPEARLIAVGPDSRERRQIEARVRREGPAGVRFVPAQAYEALPRYHRSADLCCSPALGNESQGYVLLEAMAARVPVVASNIDGYASVITHDVSGALVTPDEPDVLAAEIVALIRDPARRARLAEGGRQRVEHYAWPRVADDIVACYERLRAPVEHPARAS